MTDEQTIERIQCQPTYATLVSERSRWTWTVLGIILAIYASLMSAVAFRPDWLRVPFGKGNAVTVGWPLAVGVILVTWLLMGLYVSRANTRFETLRETILADARR